MSGTSGHRLDSEFQVGPAAQLTVSGHSGQVVVKSTSEPVIRVRVEAYDEDDFAESDPVSTTRAGDHIRVSIDPSCGDLDLEASVPHGCNVKIGTVDGDVRVHGIHGPVDVETVDGDVDVIEVRKRCHIKTVGGDIHIDMAAGECLVTTVDGDVEADRVSGDLRMTATNGEVTISNSALRSAVVDSVNGDLDVETSLHEGGTYVLKSISGDVTLKLPPDAAATIAMKTQDGDLYPGTELQSMVREKHSLTGLLNGGGAQVSLESLNGDVRMSHRSAFARSQEHGYADHDGGTHPTPPVPPMSPMPAMPAFSSMPPMEPMQPFSPVPPIDPVPPSEPVPQGSFDGDGSPDFPRHDDTISVLARLERGEISVEDAMAALDRLT